MFPNQRKNRPHIGSSGDLAGSAAEMQSVHSTTTLSKCRHDFHMMLETGQGRRSCWRVTLHEVEMDVSIAGASNVACTFGRLPMAHVVWLYHSEFDPHP